MTRSGVRRFWGGGLRAVLLGVSRCRIPSTSREVCSPWPCGRLKQGSGNRGGVFLTRLFRSSIDFARKARHDVTGCGFPCRTHLLGLCWLSSPPELTSWSLSFKSVLKVRLGGFAWGWEVFDCGAFDYEVGVAPLQGDVLHELGELGEWWVVGMFFCLVPESVPLPTALDVVRKLRHYRSKEDRFIEDSESFQLTIVFSTLQAE